MPNYGANLRYNSNSQTQAPQAQADFNPIQSFLQLRQQVTGGLNPVSQPQQQPLGVTTPYSYSGGTQTSGSVAPAVLGKGGYTGQGWQQGLSPAEQYILQHESGFNPAAKNPTSTAFGIWQGLESTRKAYLGNDYQTTDPYKQLNAFRSYVKNRYGTAENAQAFWQKNHWY